MRFIKILDVIPERYIQECRFCHSLLYYGQADIDDENVIRCPKCGAFLAADKGHMQFIYVTDQHELVNKNISKDSTSLKPCPFCGCDENGT